MGHLYPRIVEKLMASELLPYFPAIMLTGPRGAGKSTSAERLGGTVVDLSEEGTRRSALDDPDALLATVSGTVIIDEWQEAPGILAALKRSVDADSGQTPGRFIVTGSARAASGAATWPGTGRLIRVRMYGLTQSELANDNHYNPVDAFFSDAPPDFGRSGLRRSDYIERIVAGRFPAVLPHRGSRRARWFDAYVDHLAERDAPLVAGSKPRPRIMREVLASCASRSARLLNKDAVSRDAGVSSVTADSHLRLLVDLSILTLLPAWHSNRLRRLTRAPRVHLTDPGLAAHLLNADASVLARDGILAGQMFESFVATELLAHAETASDRTELFHYRNRDGREVDLLLERRGTVVGIEVKAASSVRREDAGHLIWLRDRLEASFRFGAVLYTGHVPYRIDHRVWALPISTLWQSPNRSPARTTTGGIGPRITDPDDI